MVNSTIMLKYITKKDLGRDPSSKLYQIPITSFKKEHKSSHVVSSRLAKMPKNIIEGRKMRGNIDIGTENRVRFQTLKYTFFTVGANKRALYCAISPAYNEGVLKQGKRSATRK